MLFGRPGKTSASPDRQILKCHFSECGPSFRSNLGLITGTTSFGFSPLDFSATKNVWPPAEFGFANSLSSTKTTKWQLRRAGQYGVVDSNDLVCLRFPGETLAHFSRAPLHPDCPTFREREE